MTISSNTRCLFDSNILVAYTIEESPHYNKAHQLFEKIANNKIYIYIAAQNILEFAAVLNRAYKLPKKVIAKGIHRFITDPLIEVIYPNKNTTSTFLQLLNKNHFLHITDIFLIATATTNNMDMIVTNDSDFKKIKEIKVYNPFIYSQLH